MECRFSLFVKFRINAAFHIGTEISSRSLSLLSPQNFSRYCIKGIIKFFPISLEVIYIDELQGYFAV